MRHNGIKRTEIKRSAYFVLAAVLFLAALWGAKGYRFAWKNMQMGELAFRMGPKTFSPATGDAYGILNSGPNFSLMAGKYYLTLNIDSDEENTVLLKTSNGARIEPSQIVIPPHNWMMKPEITLLDDAENFEILVDYQAGSYLSVYEISMSMPCTDRIWMLMLAVLTGGILYLLYKKGRLTEESMRILVLLGAAVAFASVPALRETLHDGHDSVFHQLRLRNLVSGLAEGQFPVRVGGHMYNGYGSAASVFYPDMVLYIPALMMLTGTTIQFAMSALFIGMNMLTAANMYVCARRIFDDRHVGVCAAILYLLANYRLTDVYARAAVGEIAAMAFLPLFILGLWEVIWGDRKCWLMLTAGATLIFQNHMLSTVLCALLAVVICALGAARLIRERRMGALLKACAATVVLNLFMLVPMISYMMQGIGAAGLAADCAREALDVSELFVTDPMFTKDIGLALLIGICVSGYALIGQADPRVKTVWICFALGAAAAFMATNLFPWDWIEAKTRGMTRYLQFPWRLLMFADFFLALGCSFGVICLAAEKKRLMMVGVLMLSVISASAQINQHALEDFCAVCYWKSNSTVALGYKEYTIAGSEPMQTLNQTSPVLTGDAELTDYEKRGTSVTAQISAKTDAQLMLPLFGYDGYRAQLDGKDIPWTLGDNNRLTVDIPAGTQGSLHVWFAGKAIWRAAELLSLAGALGLASLELRRRRRLGCR